MNKSEQVNELHEKAMKIAQTAFVARMQGQLENVKQLSYQAFPVFLVYRQRPLHTDSDDTAENALSD